MTPNERALLLAVAKYVHLHILDCGLHQRTALFQAIAAARAALRYFVGSLSEFHGGDHHDDDCPDCRAMLEHAPTIAAARAEGGE